MRVEYFSWLLKDKKIVKQKERMNTLFVEKTEVQVKQKKNRKAALKQKRISPIIMNFSSF